MRWKMSGRLPQPEKAEAGGPFFIFCILEVLALDNPRTTVYNKDKERRWLHSGQLPLSVSHFEKHDRRSLEDYRGGHFFLCFFLCTLVLDNPRTAVYNKNKERRYPCKRLAPHQSSITKVMTATGLGVLGGHFFLCFFLLLP
jgi:hypothetical protein